MEVARAKRLLIRGLNLRCPACGLGALYQSFFKMHDQCDYCGLIYTREQGYFVGAIYLNVVATESLIFATYLSLIVAVGAADPIVYTVLFVLAFTLPVLFNRHARSLWLSVDYLLDPPKQPAEPAR
ncbi:MAG: DUF983 domain-containing protein [Blastocatellia bacterium]